MGATADFLAEFVGDTANVGAFSAGQNEVANWLLIGVELKIVDVDQARFAFHFNAFAREFV